MPKHTVNRMAKKLLVNNLPIYEQGAGAQTAVFLHGYGANGRDLLGLSPLFPGWHLYFPEGPIVLDQFYIDAHAWFNIDLETLSLDHAQLQNSAKILLKALQELTVDPKRTVIAGFSQGAMMALEVALLSPEPFLGVGLFSTTLVDPEIKMRAAEKRVAFFQSHGHHDSLLPYAAAQKLYRQLTEAGWKGSFVDFPGEHELPEEVLFRFKDFVDALNNQ
jgi:phospholipase/carboxylesterase